MRAERMFVSKQAQPALPGYGMYVTSERIFISLRLVLFFPVFLVMKLLDSVHYTNRRLR